MMVPMDAEARGAGAQGDGAAVRVLAAVIRRDGRWLLCRRPSHKRHGGCWEFPGGKLEPGESLLQAARRELAEELAVEVTAVGGVLYVRGDPGTPFLIEFTEVAVRGEPQPLEHDELRWVGAAEAGRLELAPADAAFVAWATRSPPGGAADGGTAP
jgi:8-oxo-dGTP diphosphatase